MERQVMVMTMMMMLVAVGNSLTLVAYPYAYTAQSSSLVTPTQQQYLAQDELGQYAYGYAEPLSSKQESRSLDGITRGSYSYRDAAGKLQTVDYRADSDGFHVAATNLPQQFRTPATSDANTQSTDGIPDPSAPAANYRTDAIDAAATSASHLAANEEARLRLATVRGAQRKSDSIESNVRLLELPAPVADTAEVAAAKSAHLKRVQAEALRNEILGAAAAASTPVIVPRVYTYAIPRYYTSGYYY